VERRPGVPRLLREINDRAALELLLATGPMTRGQIGDRTGLSKVTASQTLSRLEERGLVEVVGAQAGGRGPNAALYSVIPSSAYVAGLEVGPELISAAVADIHGQTIAEVTVDPADLDDPVPVVHGAIMKACRSAKISIGRLRGVVIGTPGVVDPRSGDVRFSFDLPGWHEGIHEALAGDLKREVTIENDVNLAAIAEQQIGHAQDHDNFVLLWGEEGIGAAIVINGRLHRGATGGAGEVAFLPLPGTPLVRNVGRNNAGGFQELAGGEPVLELAREHGLKARTPEAAIAVALQTEGAGDAVLAEFAHRLAVGLAAIVAVVDPELIVLAGGVITAGGDRLRGLIQDELADLAVPRPQLLMTAISTDPVLSGALQSALSTTRDEVFDTAGPPIP
jgi:predicted NBD/HSP70 family sugar kinase